MVDHYALAKPTAADLLRSLSEVVGRESAVAALGVAVRDAVSPTASLDELSLEQLLDVARALIRQRGLFAIIGRSFEIRVSTYLELDERVEDGPPRFEPHPDPERLRELAALELGADIDEPALQALVERAAAELELPAAAVSIILDSAQYLIANHGLAGWLATTSGTPDEWAFCRNAVASREPFIVEDARVHPLVRDNPLVRDDAIGCYLGVPLTTRNGQILGTLCVVGVRRRKFSATDTQRLQALADEVLALLERRRG